MQLNTLMKSVIMAISLTVLVGCHNTTETDSGDGYQNNDPTFNNRNQGQGGWSSDIPAAQLDRLKQDNVVYFGFDKYDVSAEYEELLNAHANYLRVNPGVRVVIEGHADERGTPEYNIALGERRANAVQMYLQGKGVPEGQMSIMSFGKEKPVVIGHDEAAYAKNRRAVLVY